MTSLCGSLCEICANYNLKLNGILDDALRQAGEPRTSVWCEATDQPEDIARESCKNFVDASLAWLNKE